MLYFDNRSAESGSRLRVSVELVRASTGVTAWAGHFDRPEADLLDVQAAIADTVAREVLDSTLADAWTSRGFAREVTDFRLAGSALAALQARSGDTAAARATAERLVAELPPPPARLTWGAGWQAGGLAATQQTDRVMGILERIEPQGLTVWWMTQFPHFDPIRHELRFAQFEAELAPPVIR